MNSLVMQSKHSQLGATTTNGDGFGVGWYGALDTPGTYPSAKPSLPPRPRNDPPGAAARAVGLIEATGQRHGVQFPIQMTVATTDGETTWAFRYSSEGRSRSLFHSTDVTTRRHQYPEIPVLHELSDDARLVVSEPLGDLRGAWREVPASTCLVVNGGREELREFSPLAQATG